MKCVDSNSGDSLEAQECWEQLLPYVRRTIHGRRTIGSNNDPREQFEAIKSDVAKRNSLSLSLPLLHVWNLNETNWSLWYQELFSYKAQHGHCSVPIRSGGKLGKWVSTQRQAYNTMHSGEKTSNTPARLQLLQDIDFDWA